MGKRPREESPPPEDTFPDKRRNTEGADTEELQEFILEVEAQLNAAREAHNARPPTDFLRLFTNGMQGPTGHAVQRSILQYLDDVDLHYLREAIPELKDENLLSPLPVQLALALFCHEQLPEPSNYKLVRTGANHSCYQRIETYPCGKASQLNNTDVPKSARLQARLIPKQCCAGKKKKYIYMSGETQLVVPSHGAHHVICSDCQKTGAKIFAKSRKFAEEDKLTRLCRDCIDAFGPLYKTGCECHHFAPKEASLCLNCRYDQHYRFRYTTASITRRLNHLQKSLWPGNPLSYVLAPHMEPRCPCGNKIDRHTPEDVKVCMICFKPNCAAGPPQTSPSMTSQDKARIEGFHRRFRPFVDFIASKDYQGSRHVPTDPKLMHEYQD